MINPLKTPHNKITLFSANLYSFLWEVMDTNKNSVTKLSKFMGPLCTCTKECLRTEGFPTPCKRTKVKRVYDVHFKGRRILSGQNSVRKNTEFSKNSVRTVYD